MIATARSSTSIGKRKPWLLAGAACVASVLLMLVFGYGSLQWEIRDAKTELQSQVVDVTNGINEKALSYQRLLQGLAVIAEVRQAGLAADWIAITKRLRGEHLQDPALLALADYKPVLSGKHAAEDPVFTSKLLAIDGELASPLVKDHDLARRLMLRDAMARARDTGEVAVSLPTSLEGELSLSGRQHFLFVLPFYQTGVPFNVSERRSQIRGFVIAECRISDLLASVMQPVSKRVSIAVTDITASSVSIPYFQVEPRSTAPLFHEEQGLIIGGRVWRLSYDSTRLYEEHLEREHYRQFIVGGVLFALFVGFLVWRLAKRWGSAETVAKRTAAQLRSSQDRLQRVIEATNDGVWEFDLRSGVYTYLSPQAIEMLGVELASAVQLKKEDARAMIHADDFPLVQAAFHKHIDQEEVYDVVMRVIQPNGGLIWVRSRGEVVRDSEGKPTTMVGSMTDVTAEKNAEIQLGRYQTLLRTVLNVIPEPILVKDKNHHLMMVNKAYAERAGTTVDDILGKTSKDWMPPEQAARSEAADQLLFETGREQVYEVAIPNARLHEVRSYVVSKRLAFNADGEPIMVGIHNDVTDLRRAIAEFSAVIQDTPLVAVVGINRSGVVTHWNRASENLYGYSRQQAIGSRVQDLLMSDRQQKQFEVLLEDIWIHQRVFGPREVIARVPSQPKLWLLTTMFPIVQEGHVVEVFAMSVNVTERRMVEQQLAEHRDNLQQMVAERTDGLVRVTQELRAALQSKSEFLANMSHELRTPMHAILSFAKLGIDRLDKAQPEKLRDYFSRIVGSGDRLLLLINDLLDLSKLEAGKMILNLDRVALSTVVNDAISELESLVLMRKISMQVNLESNLPTIEADPKRLMQVLNNLLSNAIKFSPEGGTVYVSAVHTKLPVGRRATDTGDKFAISLTIGDEGVGIPESELEAIFDKFVQSTKTRTGSGGTGLGLSIAREIVMAHHGRIKARNRFGGGAEFEVVLPIEFPVIVAGVSAEDEL